MKIADKNNGVLVLRGQGWLHFALLIVATGATPLFVWITVQFELWKMLPLAVLVPVLMLVAYRNQYKNWQLVLEADYGLGTFYEGRWLSRQQALNFELADLQKAEVLSKEVQYYDSKLRERSVTEHYLILKIAGRYEPFTIGIGKFSDMQRLSCCINKWLARHRSRFPTDIAQAS